MSYWRPYTSPIRVLLAILPLLCIGGAIWLWGPLSARSAQNRFDTGVFLLGLAFFLTLVLAGLLIYIAWCHWSIGYRTSSTQLIIRCGGVRHIIPFDAVKAVLGPGEQVGGQAV